MENLDLKKLLDVDRLKSLFSSLSSKNCGVGIDLGNGSIKIVELEKKKQGIFLRNFISIRLNDSQGLTGNNRYQVIGEVVKRALDEIKWEIESANISVPTSSSLITSVDFQNASNEEINQQIQLEASKYIPIPLNEVIYGWEIIEKSTLNKEKAENNNNENNKKEGDKEKNREISRKKAVIVAVMKEISRKYEQAMSFCQIAVDVLEVEVFSLARCLGRARKSSLIVDFGEQSVNLVVTLGRQPIIVRSLDVGGNKITNLIAHYLKIDTKRAEKIKKDDGLRNNSEEIKAGIVALLNPLREEIVAIKNTFNQDFVERPIEDILITGGGSQLPGLREHLENSLKMPVYLGNPFAEIELPNEIKEKENFAGISQQYSVATGLAMLDLLDKKTDF